MKIVLHTARPPLTLVDPLRDLLAVAATNATITSLDTLGRGLVATSTAMPPLRTQDPTTYMLAAGLVLVVGIAAVWFPARRVTRLSPATVLRENLQPGVEV